MRSKWSSLDIGCRENYRPNEPRALLELRVIPQQGKTRRQHDNKVIKKGLTRFAFLSLKGSFSLRMDESQKK